MMPWNKVIAKWKRARLGAIEFDSRGFRTTRRGVSRRLAWADVRKIEVFRIPTAMLEDFVVAMVGTEADPLMIDDCYPEFMEFQGEVWARWPEVKDHWAKIYCGNPDSPEHAVLWERVGT